MIELLEQKIPSLENSCSTNIRNVMELTLTHNVGNRVAQAWAGSGLLVKRWRLMDQVEHSRSV